MWPNTPSAILFDIYWIIQWNSCGHERERKKKILLRHNLSSHSLNKVPQILSSWWHSFIRILCFQYVLLLDLKTLSKLNPKRASEYLCGSETLQIVQLGEERSKSFIGPTLAQDRDYSKEYCVTGRWLEGCGLAPDTLLLEQTVHCAETLHVPVKTLSQITSTKESSVWWIRRGFGRSRLCSPLTVFVVRIKCLT